MLSNRTWAFPLLCLALLATAALAGDSAWTLSGSPFGGPVYRVVVDPSTPTTLYALSGPGVYKSTDAGTHWDLSLDLLPGGFSGFAGAYDIAIEPGHPATIYVASNDSSDVGVYKTTDGGDTWTAVNTGFVPPPFLPPTSPYIDFADFVSVDPVHDGVAYAAMNQTGIFKTVDGGAHWNPINTGIGPSDATDLLGPSAYIGRVVVDPANTQTLYFVAEIFPAAPHCCANGGVYVSTDGGGHWRHALSGNAYSTLVIDPADDQHLIVGGPGQSLRSSSDGGASWAPVAISLSSSVNPSYPITLVAFDPADSLHIWAAGSSGLDVTSDGGATWAPVQAGYGLTPTDLALDPNTPGVMYLASYAFGVSRSGDGGATWSNINTGIESVQLQQMLMDTSGTIYATSAASGVFKSADQGLTWDAIDDGMEAWTGAGGVATLVADPTAADSYYVATPSSLYRTQDGGATWSAISYGPDIYAAASFALAPGAPLTFYAGAVDGTLDQSVDGGATWRRADTGLPIGSDAIMSLAVSAGDGKTAFAGTSNHGLYKTQDGGSSWSVIGASSLPASANIAAITIDPKTPTILYASVADQGIYKSTDGGDTWVDSSNGIKDPGGNLFVSLSVDPNDSNVLYTVELGGAAYISGDAGADWTSLSVPSRTRRATQTRALAAVKTPVTSSSGPLGLTALTFDRAHPTTVYASATDGQVYRLNLTKLPSGSGKPTSAASSGGGGVWILTDLLLLAFATSRRRRKRSPS